VNNREPFAAPAEGRLTAADVAVIYAIWRTVEPALAEERAALDRRYHQAIRSGDERTDAQLLQARTAWRRRGLAIDLRAMPAQVPVLNAYGMSLAEYRWAKRAFLESFMQIQKEDFALYLVESKGKIVGPPEATTQVIAEGQPAIGTLGANVARVRSHGDFDASVFKLSNVGF